MILRNILLVGAAVGAVGAFAVQHHEGWKEETPREPMTFTAESMAVDNVTYAAVASGHVHAVHAPYSLRGELLERAADGTTIFHSPTCVTTCTNEVGQTHWNVTGEVVYKSHDSVVVRDAWVRAYEIPIAYLPYLWYPLDTQCGFEWMPGYTSRWGAFLLTRLSYDIIGDSHDKESESPWLRGATNLDLRWKQGAAIGEDLAWNLTDFGAGDFRFYHAWDRDVKKRYAKTGYNEFAKWGSDVENKRFGATIDHAWQATERDRVFARAAYYSDLYFRNDYYRRSFFELKSQWRSYQNSGVFREHIENAFSIGAEVSGRLNDFYGATERLPEVYVDVNPIPVFGLPINYESQTRLGWLTRRDAETAALPTSVFASNPGLWAHYETFRVDTYHRLTAPFRTVDDLVSVVPRVGYRGTYWHDTGLSNYYGNESRHDEGGMMRTIGEVGVTLASRATGWVDDETSHMIEPYLDILAQKAWHTSNRNGRRPYVFDNLDASQMWEDQFAGRGRNLPYSYYGLTPGLRNSWSRLEESGNLRQFLDFDVYGAVMFKEAEFFGDPTYGRYESHRLAKLGSRNYGERDVNLMPGARLMWTPLANFSFRSRAEYDTDNSRMALADIELAHMVTRTFSYNLAYGVRSHRYWDFSSSPYSYAETGRDNLNEVRYQYVRLSGEYQPLDWLAFGPFVRWDIQTGTLDSIGGWIDYLTDCLGFRLMLEYEKGYTLFDGYHYDNEFSVGFYVYLRAFGKDSGNIFGSR